MTDGAKPVAWAAGSGLVAPIVRNKDAAQRLSSEHGDGTVVSLCECAELIERCARIAENYDLGTPEGHEIATAIRSLKEAA